jgi:hypothetical protein
MCCGNCKSTEESGVEVLKKLNHVIINNAINYVDSIQTLLDKIDEDEDLIEVAKTMTDHMGQCLITYMRTADEIG